jgi:hypothetical protein
MKRKCLMYVLRMTNGRPDLSSERAPQRDKTAAFRQVTSPRVGSTDRVLDSDAGLPRHWDCLYATVPRRGAQPGTCDLSEGGRVCKLQCTNLETYEQRIFQERLPTNRTGRRHFHPCASLEGWRHRAPAPAAAEIRAFPLPKGGRSPTTAELRSCRGQPSLPASQFSFCV